MGGFCAIRMTCGRFHATSEHMVAEHLCAPKSRDAWQPIRTSSNYLELFQGDKNPVLMDEISEEGAWI